MVSGATLENWMRPPFNTDAYQRLGEIIPTARIAAGTVPGSALAPAPFPIMGAAGPVEDAVKALLDGTYPDALVVLHRGRLVHEAYYNGMRPETRHLCMSVSKSITATAVGCVIAEGALAPSDLVVDVLPELRATGLAGATVRHLLDMRTGTREDITTLELQRAYFAACGWAPPVPPVPPSAPAGEDSRSHFYRFAQTRPHGGDFEYRSTLTCVLAMVAERVAGAPLPELISRYVWGPMGAEYDAEITVDPAGHALADIGVCCTVRDLARLGDLLLSDGGGVVPADWVADTLTPEPGQVDAFPPYGAAFFPAGEGAYYRNQWWVARPRTTPDARDGVYFALGINGQLLFIDESSETVIAKFSSWPEPWLDDVVRYTLTTCRAIAAAIGGPLR